MHFNITENGKILFVTSRLWDPCLRDIILYDITRICHDDEMMCDDEHRLYDHALPRFQTLYRLKFHEKATSLNDRYHAIVDYMMMPKHICLLLSLHFFRNLLRKHDYWILQYYIRCWIALFPLVKKLGKYPSSMHTSRGHHIGGGASELFSLAQLQPYLLKNHIMFTPSADVMYKFENHCVINKQIEKDLVNIDTLLCDVPLGKIINNLTITSLKLVAAVHGIYIKTRTPLSEVLKIIQDHNCDHCKNCITLFRPAKSLVKRRREANVRAVRKYKNTKICLNSKIPLATENPKYDKTSDPLFDGIENNGTFPPSSLDQKMEH